jgi:hypothetical protein
MPEQDEVEKASARLLKLRRTMITGTVVEPIGAGWGGDTDNL